VNPVHAREKPAEVTATDFRLNIAEILTNAKYGHPTVITNNAKPIAKVVHPDAGTTPLDPECVDRALRAVIAELDYDLHKALERDEDHKTVAAFIAAYEEAPDGR
jgi:prevent-host-death family protein